jgi:DNA-binding transcriptional ArsR family regulator
MRQHWYSHVEPELRETLRWIRQGCADSDLIHRVTGLHPRRVQRRLKELRDEGLIIQVKNRRLDAGSLIPVYGLTNTGVDVLLDE